MGASHLLPANVLGAHVTRWGHKPVPFACAVAMSARFGFDIDPAGLDDDERTAAQEAVQGYRRIRPLVQQGDLHRLVSPIGSDQAALAYLAPEAAAAEDTGEPCAVVFAYLLEGEARDVPAIALRGLDPDRRYRVVDVTPGDPDRSEAFQRTGRELAGEGGLPWPTAAGPSAKVWEISPVA